MPDKYFLFSYRTSERPDLHYRWFAVGGCLPDEIIKTYLDTLGAWEYDGFDSNKYRFVNYVLEVVDREWFDSSIEVAKWIARKTYVKPAMSNKLNYYSKDNNGNEVRCIGSDVDLRLKNHGKFMYVGSYDDEGNFVRGKRSPLNENKHRMKKKFNGFAINAEILRRMPGKYVIIITDKAKFKAPKTRILSDNIELFFGRQGYEEQYGIRQSICTIEGAEQDT